MNAVRYSGTLLYYDGLQLFEARDAIGGHYLAMLLDQLVDGDRYLVVGVSPEGLARFRMGELDLRSLILDLGREVWYLTTIPGDLDDALLLTPQSELLQDNSLLPDEGFLLHGHPTTDEVLREARRRRNLVVEIAADPPESLAGHRIRMETLADLLGRVQQLAKHAYRAALRDVAPAKRATTDVREGYLMDVVVPAAPGSFKVILEASSIPDTTLNLFGQSQLTYALQRIDELFKFASDPDQSVPIVQRHRGRVATAYLGLLRFLVERDTGLRYSWAEPTSDRPRHRSVSKNDARSLVDAFSVVSGIGSEPVTVVGRFAKFNRSTGDWGLVGAKEQYSGKVRDDGPSLDGLKVGEMYRFYCTEETVETDRTGRQSRTLYLNEHERA